MEKPKTVLAQASPMQDEQGGTTPSNWNCAETTCRGSGFGGGGRRREASETDPAPTMMPLWMKPRR